MDPASSGYPVLAGRTRRFSYGSPRAFTVSADGARIAFLRSLGPVDPVDRLWMFKVRTGEERLVADPPALLGEAPEGDMPAHERAIRERMRVSARGIGSYATDLAGRVAAFALGGRLFRANLVRGTTAELAAGGAVFDPRPDPTGRRLAYVRDGSLYVVDTDGGHRLLAGEDSPHVSWGVAEFIAAEEFDRHRGYWWSPDGERVLAARVDESRVPRWYLADPTEPGEEPRAIAYPHAGAPNADVSLHLLNLDGSWVDVRWDRETYPYLVAVTWELHGPALVTVMRRNQQHGLVFAVDARPGDTQVHAELADPRWVELTPGTPAYLPDGRVLLAGDLVQGGHDARCLFADGGLMTPGHLYVRRVAGRLGADLLVEASDGEPGEQHLYRVTAPPGTAAGEAFRLTTRPGWHVGYAGGTTLLVGSASLDHAGMRWTVHASGTSREIPSYPADPPYAPLPVLSRVTDRRLPTGVLYPRSHVSGRRLPVLVDVYGGPHRQEVVAARSVWIERQWWADHGVAVVVVDNRGTPGVGPAFEKAIHRRVADVVLADQVDALTALAAKHPDLDLDRVAIRGWSFGGWLAALGVLRRPDVYHAGIAGAPCTDWSLYDTAYTERYLGLPEDDPVVYERHSLLGDAPGLTRPLLLLHGLTDDNVVPAHTLRLSAALLAAGRPHTVMPLPGTHLARGGLVEPVLTIELDFLRRSLRL